MKRDRMSIERDGNALIMRVPFQPPKRSASGKTWVIATSHGPAMSNVRFHGAPVKVLLNAYFDADAELPEPTAKGQAGVGKKRRSQDSKPQPRKST